MTIRLAAAAAALLAVLPLRASAAQDMSGDAGKAPASAMKAGKMPTLTAKLVNAEEKAKNKAATVEVKVRGIRLVDPALSKEKPIKGQGHLHYRVDNGPIIATTATKLSFHELTSGAHTFTIMLAANDHSPLGPSATLNVTVP